MPSDSDLPDAGFRAWVAVFQAQAAMARTLDRDLKQSVGAGLTSCEVLSTLGAAPQGRLRMQDLGRQVFLSRSGISQAVNQLVSQGLVERQCDPDDLRSIFAVLTDKGREVLSRCAPALHGEVRGRFSEHLTEAEARTVTEAMGKVLRALGEQPG
ncbi:MarR family winged helix-turn-helix transcriptional regulator [Kutzneria viridogrisea]|uniref:HTH marR-type domain-containing protein n=2 Tax=Kutzneria TaxID=43356 RepID=W5W980_9PSEU|nr:MarR family transcriptional regulator [Kutzneria albida]AHH97658.1 hypothetical protein KALB_4296 [Kutzneria albida DSM 43870]MBA8924754.1 DNA-binding MarR family transcriptional regulator [Kutzneria viridogrisea]